MDNVFLNEALKRLLNLPTHPVSVKYIETFDEDVEWELADLGFYRPRNPVNLCQGVGLARHHGRKVLLAAEDMACIIGAAAGGLHPFDNVLASGEIGVKDGIRCSPELCREMFETLPRIEHGEVEAVAFAPLKEMPLEFDQVILYGTPLEMLKVITAYLYDREARLDMSTCAKYGVCVEGMASSYNSGELTVGFPCRGERVSSMVQDHEIYVTIPAEHLEAVVTGLEATKHLLPSPMPFGGVDQEPTFLPDYYLTEESKGRMGRKVRS